MAVTRQDLITLGLTEEELLDVQLEYIDESIDVYNDRYGTNYTLDNLPEFLLAYAVLNVLMTLNGWQDGYSNRFDNRTINIIQDIYGEDYQDYGGIQETNRQRLENMRLDEMTEEEKEGFIDDRTEAVMIGLFAGYQVTQSVLADEDNRTIVGVITKNDSRVRDSHRPNHKTFWDKDSRRDFSKDYNCRCEYFYFTSEEEARQAGFDKF